MPGDSTSAGVPPTGVVALSDGAVDLGREVVSRAGRETPLTTREVALLAYLASRPGQVVSREELYSEVWGYAAGVVSRTVDTTVRRLRTKIEPDPANPTHLQTVHGRGYRFLPPVAPDDLVGRRAELLAIERTLAAVPLVGVVGGPGVGKTHLLREIASRAEHGPGGVVWCEASGATSAAALAFRVAAAARVSMAEGDPVARVAAVLDGRGGLFVIDGVEPGAAEALVHWRRAGTRARVVFAARQRFPVPASYVEVGPMDPDDAAALFVVRARAVDPSFDADPALVAKLVERLDSWPLAIELAASRLHVLSAHTLLERLDTGVQVLGTALQRSLTSAIDGLPPHLRTALIQCAIFRHAFALDAAEVVITGVPSVLDALHGLRDRSLLRLTRDGDVHRFTVANTVRALVLDREPATESEAATRLRRWLIDHGGFLAGEVDGPDAPSALAELRRLRIELHAALEQAEPDDVVPLVQILDVLLEIDGPAEERVAVLSAAALRAGSSRRVILARRAEALRGVGRIDAAREAAEQILSEARATGDADAVARCVAVAVACGAPLDVRACEWALAALDQHRTGQQVAKGSLPPSISPAGDAPDPEDNTKRMALSTRLWLAMAEDARRRRDRGGVDAALRRAAEIVQSARLARYEATVLSLRAVCRREAGQLADAELLYRGAAQAAARVGQARTEAHAVHEVARLLADRGDWANALSEVRLAAEVARAIGETALLGTITFTTGTILHQAGLLADAEAALQDAIRLLRGEDAKLAASLHGDLGAVLADRGLVTEAERAFHDAEVGIGDDPLLQAILFVQRAHLDLARARAAADASERERHLGRTRTRIETAVGAGGERGHRAAELVRARWSAELPPPAEVPA